ncbi:MAG: SusC/RagA family TonB-linked outer membrane protein [Balneolales bacterium]
MIKENTKKFRAINYRSLTVLMLFWLITTSSSTSFALGTANNSQEISFNQGINDHATDDQRSVTFGSSEMHLSSALEKLAREANVGISFNPDVIPDKKVTFDFNNVAVDQALYTLLDGSGLVATLSPSKDVLLIKSMGEHFAGLNIGNEAVQEEVTGTVTDANTGEILPGVNITLRGTSTGTTTNMDGEYSITVPDNAGVLVFSYIGYRALEVPVEGREVVDVSMDFNTAQLDDDLVVVGYGVQRRSEITGSVGIASSEDLEQPTFNALQSLRGKVAGVNIFSNSGAPTGSNRVIIRGIGSINASSDPLYVVDGVVMENGIGMMNPNDIQSIEVLKDASSTAIYGARGANGVILVTTERGGTDGGVTVGYNTDFSAGRMRGRMDVMNSEEFMAVQRIGVENAPLFNDYAPGTEPVFDTSDPRLFDAQGNPLYDTDWQSEATRTALSQNHQLSIQSGDDESSFGAFLNYTDRQGIFINSYMERANLKLVYDVSPRDWLKMGTNLTVGKTWENYIQESGGGQDAKRTIIEMPPIFPVRWEDGTYTNSTHAEDFTFEGQANPVHMLREQDRLRDRTQIFGNTFLAFQINPYLELRTQVGADVNQYEGRDYNPNDLMSGGFPNGSASISNNESIYWQNENFLTYVRDFGSHRINSVLGASWQQNLFRSNDLSTGGFSDNFFRYNNVGTATDPDAPSSNANDWSMNSYFTRVSYTYDNTYMLTFTSRVDGSSRFGADNKYGFFPSAGAAWLVSNEDFMSDINFVDHFRLRTSYGVTGNTEIGLYNSLATIGSGTTLIGGDRQPSSFVQRMPNPELEWEKTHQFNIGTELNLFNQAISLEADYYYKLTNDLLLDRPVPTTSGFTTIFDNIGSLSNRGVDFMITTRNLRSSDLFWSTTLNFNYNKNRVESLGAEDEDIFPGPNWVSGSQTILRVGEPIGNFYGFIREGTWGTDEVEEAAAAGRIPGEAKRSEDRTIIGNGLPDWTGSFINRFNFKNFDFTADFQFVLGSEIMQQFLHTAEDRQALTNGLATQYYNAWTEDNQNTMYQRIRHQPYSGQNTQADSHWIVDGSYIRANLFSLGYTFDQSMLTRMGLQQLRITANLENAFVIHHPDFKGSDPEATSWGGNLHAQNIFFYQYPRPRTITLGLNLNF